jgi:hypothetical protein
MKFFLSKIEQSRLDERINIIDEEAIFTASELDIRDEFELRFH